VQNSVQKYAGVFWEIRKTCRASKLQNQSTDVADSVIAPTIGVDIFLCRNYFSSRRRLKGLVK
jgi:hypothetical protein